MDYKKLLIILSIVVLAEAGWFGWRVYSLKVSKVSPNQKYGSGQVSVSRVLKGAKLWLEPESGEFSGQFTVDIFVQTEVPIGAVDVHLFYPKDKLAVIDQDANTEGVQVAGGKLDDYPVNKIDEEKGMVLLSGIIFGRMNKEGAGVPLNQPFLVGSVVFNTLGGGEASLVFEFEPGSTRDCNVAGKESLTDILKEAQGAKFILMKNEE